MTFRWRPSYGSDRSSWWLIGAYTPEHTWRYEIRNASG